MYKEVTDILCYYVFPVWRQDDGHNTEPQENEEQMEENLQGVNDRVKTSHVAPCAVQSETAQDETTGQNDQKEVSSESF